MPIKIKKAHILIIFIIILFHSRIALSQVACPPGMIPYSSGGGGVYPCGPDPNYTPPQPSTPKIQWEDRWGAIAQNEKSGPGYVGVSFDQTSKRKAKKVAIEDCESRGGRNCRADFTYKNQCAAIVSGEKSYHLTSAASLDESIRDGLMYCQESGNKNCEVKYTNCTDAARVN